MKRYLAVITLFLAFTIPSFAKGGHGHGGHRGMKSHKVRVHKPHKPRKHKGF